MIILIALLFVIVGLVLGICKDQMDYDGFLERTISSLGAIVVVACLFAAFVVAEYTDPKPKAIDVYRGKTKLIIKTTAVNGVVVHSDSIVVWKLAPVAE